MNDTKAKIFRELNKAKISNESVYAIWTDEKHCFDVRIVPQPGHLEVKVISVLDPAIVQRLSHFCGLQTPPRRKNWKGFDLITGLEESGKFEFRRGVVHMPNPTRLTYVDLEGRDNKELLLKFYFFEKTETREVRKYSGFAAVKKGQASPVAYPTIRIFF